VATDITVSGLTHIFENDISALEGISLKISQGESVAVIGENGAGKTTLIKHFNGLLQPSAGRVMLAGEDVATMRSPQLARKVGFVFQNPEDQIFCRTVADEVGYGLRLAGLKASNAETEDRIDRALQAVGLTEYKDENPQDLRFQHRKMVTIASVLVMDTDIVILDEPTMGQDQYGIDLLGAMIEQLASNGKTVIIVSHDMNFCASRFKRILLLQKGKVVSDGGSADIFSQHDLLLAANVNPPSVSKLAALLGLSPTIMHETELLSHLKKNTITKRRSSVYETK
jgi:energy-coupling factor transport system ATP-binding protein